MSERNALDITYTSIFRVLAVAVGLYVAFLVRDIIALVLVSLFFTAAITPMVNWFYKRRIPRGVAVLIIYLVAFGVFSVGLILIVPPVIEQVNQFSTNAPQIVDTLTSSFSQLRGSDGELHTQVQETVQPLQNALNSATEGVFNTLSNIFGGIIFFIAMLVLTFYMVTNHALMLKAFEFLSPKKYHHYIHGFIDRTQVQLGRWLRGQLTLMLFIAVLTYTGLAIMGVKYALVLAIIAGLFEFIPYAGPLLAGIPAVIIALPVSPYLAIAVVIWYVLVQEVENNFLVPKIMQKAVGINPIVTIIAILVAVKLVGLIGAIIAVPAVSILSMLLSDIYEGKFLKEHNA